MFKKDLLENIVLQLTDNYTKSQSVNYTYKMCQKIVEKKFDEMKEFDFNELIIWLETIKTNYCKQKYKCIKRIIYSFNHVLNGFEINNDIKFVYHNDNNVFKKLPYESRTIIENYLNTKSLMSSNTKVANRNYLSLFFKYLYSIDVQFENITFDIIYNFYDYEIKKHNSLVNFTKIINYVAFFLNEGAPTDELKLGSLLLPQLTKKYADAIINSNTVDIKKEIIISYPINKITSFLSLMTEKGYCKKTIKNSKMCIEYFLLFCCYHKLPLNYDSVYLWTNILFENNYKIYRAHRARCIQFCDYINSGDFSFDNTYSNYSCDSIHKPLHLYELIPLWAKPITDEYIDYRIRLGYQNNTINMDKNSLYRFVSFLDNQNIKNFHQLTPQILIHYNITDTHNTIAGKNAYMSRIKSFLVYLNDKNETNIYPYQKIIGNCKIGKKIVNVISDEDMNLIYNHTYNSPIELRSIAIVLLGLQVGLRSIDIVNLKYNNISFKNKTITLMQKKVRKEITLPLSNRVLNALYKYVKFARPNISSEYIFVSHKFPYKNLDRTRCKDSLKIILKIINKENKYSGFHICRRTFATLVLKNTGDINITSFSLGHSNNKTIDDYISINENEMRNCGLPLSNIVYRGFQNE